MEHLKQVNNLPIVHSFILQFLFLVWFIMMRYLNVARKQKKTETLTFRSVKETDYFCLDILLCN